MDKSKVRLRVERLRWVADREPMVWHELLNRGEMRAGMLEVSREGFEEVVARHYGAGAAGTALHGILEPVVAVVDQVVGTRLQGCGGCAERELAVNAVGARVTGWAARAWRGLRGGVARWARGLRGGGE